MAAKQANNTFTKVFRAFLVMLLFTGFGYNSVLASSSEEEGFNASEVILHHVMDDHVWHFVDGHYGTLHLPIILYSEAKGFDIFSSSNFYDEDHNLKPYKGYVLEHGHITLENNPDAFVLDLSITKTVFMLMITAVVVLLIFIAVARKYKTNTGKAPTGIQSFFEPIIVFVRDEVAKPNIGDKKYEKFMPFLLSLFFFILFGNILGLLPGAANLTGNIAVTTVLALFTFVITNINGNKHYWKHIFWTPGVPLPLKFIIVPVEILGVFTKPFALLIRLFVAITAGHIVMLALICLAFIFQSYAVGVGSTIIVLFISLIELLVAAIQAYVFTMFSALYIGMATEEHH
ncbi:MAG TPA: F0F1 ATP synthase subunit A [Fulvivirga sp.]|nr:F0F1 ATP synthase subunit A [Fulvivirga sp.]